MYALAVNGSPHGNGNTKILLEQVLDPLKAASWRTELFQLGGQLVRGCQGCNACFKMRNFRCVMDQDCANTLIEKMREADAIIIGSPTYFSDVSAETKAILDRAGFVSKANDTFLRGKIGAAVVAVRRAGGVHVYDSINHMFLINNMIIPGSNYWNLGIGLTPGQVLDDSEGISNMRNLGETIAMLGKALEPLKGKWPK